MNNITCICLGVKDMERSIKFYRDGLGYKTDCRENNPSVCFFDTGSYDEEPKSFEQMNEFARKRDLTRIGDFHKEIYLSNKNRTSEEKQKTILRYSVK